MNSFITTMIILFIFIPILIQVGEFLYDVAKPEKEKSCKKKKL